MDEIRSVLFPSRKWLWRETSTDLEYIFSISISLLLSSSALFNLCGYDLNKIELLSKNCIILEHWIETAVWNSV